MKDNHDHFRDAQRATISLYFRESEAGWLFYDDRGCAHHIFTDEAEALEAEACAALERFLAISRRRANQMIYAFLLAFALAIGMTPLWHGPWHLLAVIVTAAGGLLVAAAFARSMWTDQRYFHNRRRWRRALGDRFARERRGGVPEPIAAHHRRYNLFRTIRLVAFSLFGLRVAWAAYTRHEGLDPIDIALATVCLLTAWPAMRVDATHRRRKWLD